MNTPGTAGELRPPSGYWYTDLPDGFEASASTRSIQRALFCSLWLAVSIWMGVSLIRGSDVPIGVILGGIVVFLAAAPLFPLSLAGRVRLSLRGDQLLVVVGVAGIGIPHRFSWSRVRKVEEFHMQGRSGSRQISIEGETTFRFGQWLTDERRRFLLAVLQRELAKSSAVRRL